MMKRFRELARVRYDTTPPTMLFERSSSKEDGQKKNNLDDINLEAPVGIR
jgi:hypothetical protein